MKKLVLFSALVLAFACKDKPKEEPQEETNKETEMQMDQKDEGWITLFDGNSFNGWHLYNAGEIDEPWKLEDGTMVFYPPKDRPEGESYNIVTDEEFTNFVLSLEWKVSKGGNSGIFWGVYEGSQYEQPYLTGPEIQVLDDENHPDAKNGTTHQAGALYDMIAPSTKAVKPAGEWNMVELTVNHETNQGHVLLNGEKIIEFPVHGEEWNNMVSKSKFADWEDFGTYKTGKIGLQDHGDIVVYRNIKIKEL